MKIADNDFRQAHISGDDLLDRTFAEILFDIDPHSRQYKAFLEKLSRVRIRPSDGTADLEMWQILPAKAASPP